MFELPANGSEDRRAYERNSRLLLWAIVAMALVVFTAVIAMTVNQGSKIDEMNGRLVKLALENEASRVQMVRDMTTMQVKLTAIEIQLPQLFAAVSSATAAAASANAALTATLVKLKEGK